jgi:hypothetical protein
VVGAGWFLPVRWPHCAGLRTTTRWVPVPRYPPPLRLARAAAGSQRIGHANVFPPRYSCGTWAPVVLPLPPVCRLQIDIAQPDQFQQYQRILTMLSRLGVGHILYAGNNSALSTPSNNTDDWGWEVCLWLNEGQQLREGEWVSGPCADQAAWTCFDGMQIAMGCHRSSAHAPAPRCDAIFSNPSCELCASERLFPMGEGTSRGSRPTRIPTPPPHTPLPPSPEGGDGTPLTSCAQSIGNIDVSGSLS